MTKEYKLTIKQEAVAPRITPADIEANIVSEHYFTARDGRRGAIQDGTYKGRERPTFGEADIVRLDFLTVYVAHATQWIHGHW